MNRLLETISNTEICYSNEIYRADEILVSDTECVQVTNVRLDDMACP
jgi:hypothetical protein